MNLSNKNWIIAALLFSATYVLLSFYDENEPTMKERAYIGIWKSKNGQIEIRKQSDYLIFLEKDNPPYKALLNHSSLLVPIKKDSVLSIYKTNKKEILISGVGFFNGENETSHIPIMDIFPLIAFLLVAWRGYVIYDRYAN